MTEIDLGCPHCHALPGQACLTPRGIVRNDHKAREWRHEHEYGKPVGERIGKGFVTKRYCECGSFTAEAS